MLLLITTVSKYKNGTLNLELTVNLYTLVPFGDAGFLYASISMDIPHIIIVS